ncbi:ABC transporter substrate-binding protein [Treponema sp. TIM-1]|uniref:ABC transporter substrate-binding protein n=1 Tax=Treponema sp. TIM-1 TaxID=2898417 RepID=UPI00397FF6B0
MKRKKRILAAALALWVVSGMFARGAQEKAPVADDDYVIKIGYGIGPGLCSAPFFIAEELGYFAEEGLKWEHVMIDIGQIPLLLTNGTIDVTNNLLDGMIQPIANGLQIKIPLGLHTGCTRIVVRKDSGIQKLSDLRGKRIGTMGLASPPNIILQRYLAEEGIRTVEPNSEVEWVVYSGPELALALKNGQVDAIATGDPPAYAAEKEGWARTIADTSKDGYLKDEYCCVVAVNNEVAKNHPAVLAKVLRAVQKAAQYTAEHPEETARLVAEKQYAAGNVEDNIGFLKAYSYRATVSGVEKGIRRTTEDLKRIGLLDSSVDVDELTNNVFIAIPGVPDSL